MALTGGQGVVHASTLGRGEVGQTWPCIQGGPGLIWALQALVERVKRALGDEVQPPGQESGS
eukprot:5101241-Alexandrium_andersonii.AAC.1